MVHDVPIERERAQPVAFVGQHPRIQLRTLQSAVVVLRTWGDTFLSERHADMKWSPRRAAPTEVTTRDGWRMPAAVPMAQAIHHCVYA